MHALLEHLAGQLQSAPVAALFLDALLKSVLVLALAGIVCSLWRGASAATRYLIWFLALASLLCLPLLNSIRPAWRQPVWAVSTVADSANEISLAFELSPRTARLPLPKLSPNDARIPTAGPAVPGPKVAAKFDPHWLLWVWFIWLGGSVTVLTRLATGQLARRQYSRSASPVNDADWMRSLANAQETLNLRRPVTLLLSANEVMPMTWGWWRPVILLPTASAGWSEDRRRIVLLHELAHIKRGDYLAQIVAQVVCALYWLNPLAWLAARHMRLERESACDDLVLAAGCQASAYAGHLVEIAGHFRHAPQVAAIAMARPSHLAGRIAAIVDASRNRRLRSVAVVALLGLIGGVALGLGGSGSDAAGATDKSGALRQQQIARLEEFSKQKEKQAELLAAAHGETISPAFHQFFTAATTGDWPTVTNLFARFQQSRSEQGMRHHPEDVRLWNDCEAPVLEIYMGYDQVVHGEPTYTQMAVDDIIHSIPPGSIYFGGTDPGRGLPTAFCKSHVEADPFYTLTQNALADGSYLEYLQRTYGHDRSLLRTLTEACRKDAVLQALSTLETNWFASTQKWRESGVNEDDAQWKASEDALNQIGAQQRERLNAILADVRAKTGNAASTESNQEPAAIYIPSQEDSQQCFQEFTEDIQKRAQAHQLKPGEGFKETQGRVQISGQTAVMGINGLLAKVIFDRNPDHEFYIEDSWALDWMYPYLEPHGLILKINRQPLSEISDATVQQDRDFWQPRVSQMIGDWLADATPVAEVTAFGEKVFLRHDLTGFNGDPRFVQNDYSAKMFSKFRASIADLYAWRAAHAADAAEKGRMARAADFAFRQAVALYPYGPNGSAEAYLSYLKSQQREEDSQLVQDLIGRLDSQSARSSHRPNPSFFQLRLVLESQTNNSQYMGGELMTNWRGGFREVLNVDKTVLLDGTALKSASVDKDFLGHPEIQIKFTDAGAKLFAAITRQHLHQRLAIIMDGKPLTAPVIQSEISDGRAQIAGSFTEEQAAALADEINQAIGK
jgi:beta-lactamase regulating signal transducer with metallopeptidase domain